MERKISEKVYYIGVNDRTTHRFEGLWPIPAGVSYNSYLALGSEKAAIIDGVEVSHSLDQIASIRRILGDRKPDYLVINHMEPDHSGSIAILRSAFPDITIVGNAQTISMVNGYYGVDTNTLTVKDGESLSLGGGSSLQFLLTPMVHWPETMVTLFAEEKTLFTGDAFGCYGALNGGVVDTEMDVEGYFPEMVRYYANIVGRYGRFVQKAMTRLADVEFDTVCPTHGPIWREHFPRVADIYDKLSRYEPLDEGATVIYGSMYGNTARMAEAAAQGIAEAGVKNIAVHDLSSSNLSYIIADLFRHRHILLAAPTYSDGLFPPMGEVIDAINLRGLSNRRVALIGSHTWAPKGIKSMSEALSAGSLELVAEPLSIKQAPGTDELAACRALGRHLVGAEC